MARDERFVSRHRLVIESSILAVTLLFIAASVKGITEDVNVIRVISLVAVWFIVAAVFGALAIFLEPPPIPSRLGTAFEFGSFLAGLVGLLGILLGISAQESAYVVFAAFLSIVAAWVGSWVFLRTWRRDAS